MTDTPFFHSGGDVFVKGTPCPAICLSKDDGRDLLAIYSEELRGAIEAGDMTAAHTVSRQATGLISARLQASRWRRCMA